MDPIAQFKENAKVGWSSFAPTEMVTGSVAPDLVRFAGIKAGLDVLDVACGTGVVALTAARLGARVKASDLTPALIERAKENATVMKLEVEFREADVEALPYADAQFDVVVSQFGHMFAPRPDVTIAEMLRVLKPGGTIAFSTWPPELYAGMMFALVGKYMGPPPAGVSPPSQWGDPKVVRERLGDKVRDLLFDRAVMRFQTLSVQHQRVFFEKNVGPIEKLVERLAGEQEKLGAFRRELEALISLYFEDNHLRQDFLLSRAIKL